jgi:hypothetical protein
MKKKIFISLATFFFAAITFYNVQVSQENGYVSLENIALMAQASSEIPPPMGRYCTMGMQYTGNYRDVAVMCSNCYPLFYYKSYGDSSTC